MICEKFHRLTVIRQDTSRKNKSRRYWMCRCECGQWVSVTTADLRSGNTKSCGCWKRDKAIEQATTHGESKSKLYGVWNAMMARCYNPNVERYSRYGARGIKVCDEWLHNYVAFRDWALSNGYTDGLTIDRIDVNGNYCPDNCRWATKADQMKNTTTNRFLTYNGETHTLSDWARIVGISASTLSRRLKRGWTMEQALSPSRITVK